MKGKTYPLPKTMRHPDGTARFAYVILALFVIQPAMSEFTSIQEELSRPEIRRLVGKTYLWPDMQYLTLKWSGRWTNIDLRFSGFRGYPYLSVLFGTHYAGFKPWRIHKTSTLRRYGRYEDFRFWFHQYENLLTQTHPELQKNRRLNTLLTATKQFYQT